MIGIFRRVFGERHTRKAIVLAAAVLLPTFLSSLYYGMVASDVYVSESRLVVHREDSVAGAGSIFGSLVRATGLTGIRYQDVVKDFVGSRNFLLQLDRELGLARHYSGENVDFLSRLSPGADEEDFLRYLRRKIRLHVEPGSEVMVLQVRAFDPAVAQTISQRIVDEAETLVNEMSRRPIESRLSYAKQEVEDALEAVRASSQILERQLAQDRYISALRTLEEVEATAMRQQVYLLAFVPPTDLHEAQEPNRARAVLTTFVLASLATSILALAGLALRDQLT
ncbi:hypothetical protein [Telmatospirillum sp. J64-1]|uniref:hypothetical protein n=1 Tax=Telmatospirillum sp. J64-1 TaxID=2502183 RepID=UPI00115E557C|nr:hypothetical protein [Telmatospirillum sp. J64-1]